jgi:hypothetical protein
MIEDDEEEEANGGEQPPSPPHDEVSDDVPPPPMGWIMKIYHKAGGDSVSHHRLMGMLVAYFGDWNSAVEYVCWEYTHPLEDTYWKSRASIFFPKDEEKETYQLDRMYSHTGRRATMEASIEDVAFEACMGLRYLRFDSMKHDAHCYFPHAHPVLGWAMMDPVQLEPLARVMVNFAYDMMERKLQLEEMVKAQEKTIKRCQEMIDELRVNQGLAKIYETFEHEPRP